MATAGTHEVRLFFIKLVAMAREAPCIFMFWHCCLCSGACCSPMSLQSAHWSQACGDMKGTDIMSCFPMCSDICGFERLWMGSSQAREQGYMTHAILLSFQQQPCFVGCPSRSVHQLNPCQNFPHLINSFHDFSHIRTITANRPIHPHHHVATAYQWHTQQ